MSAQSMVSEPKQHLLEFLSSLILVAVQVRQQTLKEIQPEKQNLLSTRIPLSIKNIQKAGINTR